MAAPAPPRLDDASWLTRPETKAVFAALAAQGIAARAVGGAVRDPLGAYADLAQRRVRFIGDAAARIREDYLRILRFFRLTADYGEGPPDAEGLAACVAERAGLGLLSAERVRQEMLRLLV